MAGSKISKYSIGDVNFTALMDTEDKQRIGYHAVSLTNYDNTTVPAIAAGSSVEVDGALYYFASDEAISVGSVADGTVYILLEPSGNNITASFTGTAPTWDDSKYGYYQTDSNENQRYLNFVMTKSGTSYSDKRMLLPDPMKDIQNLTVENLDADAFVIQSIVSGGYAKIGPLYFQWGTVSGPFANNTTVTFPVAFPNACFAVTQGGTADISNDTGAYTHTVTKTNFKVSNYDNATALTYDMQWIAIGY